VRSQKDGVGVEGPTTKSRMSKTRPRRKTMKFLEITTIYELFEKMKTMPECRLVVFENGLLIPEGEGSWVEIQGSGLVLLTPADEIKMVWHDIEGESR
jgi:hypothetical protein